MELPKLYTKFYEVGDRPDFDSEAEITLENFSSIVGEYRFPEEERCQVRKKEGLCGQKHKHGWLGKTKEGKEALIGGNCAVKYFNADKNFSAERSRVRREIGITENLNKLKILLKDKEGFRNEVNAINSRLKFVRQSIKNIEEQIPGNVLAKLKDMVKTGNRKITIQIQYTEKDEKGKEQTSWVDQSIGNVSGISIWEYSSLGTLFKEIHEIKEIIDEVKLSREAGDRRLKNWASTLSKLPSVSSSIDGIQSELDRFTTFDNLSKLIFLTSNHDKQLILSLLALKHIGNAKPSNNDGRKLISEISAQIRQTNSGRNFRVPK